MQHFLQNKKAQKQVNDKYYFHPYLQDSAEKNDLVSFCKRYARSRVNCNKSSLETKVVLGEVNNTHPSLACRGGGRGGVKHKKSAFTLAEVLITIGIIGVVAAMTLPTLIQNYRNHVVETRLKSFYTIFNQAIRLAEVQHGDKKDWYLDANGIVLDEDGNPIEGTSQVDIWFTKYLGDNIKIVKKKIDKAGTVFYYLPNGSTFRLGNSVVASVREIFFYPGNPDNCPNDTLGVCVFDFEFYPIKNDSTWQYLYNKGVEPCLVCWNGTREILMNSTSWGCKNGNQAYCTALIWYNNWKIPKDYPLKVRY